MFNTRADPSALDDRQTLTTNSQEGPEQRSRAQSLAVWRNVCKHKCKRFIYITVLFWPETIGLKPAESLTEWKLGPSIWRLTVSCVFANATLHLRSEFHKRNEGTLHGTKYSVWWKGVDGIWPRLCQVSWHQIWQKPTKDTAKMQRVAPLGQDPLAKRCLKLHSKGQTCRIYKVSRAPSEPSPSRLKSSCAKGTAVTAWGGKNHMMMSIQKMSYTGGCTGTGYQKLACTKPGRKSRSCVRIGPYRTMRYA